MAQPTEVTFHLTQQPLGRFPSVSFETLQEAHRYVSSVYNALIAGNDTFRNDNELLVTYQRNSYRHRQSAVSPQERDWLEKEADWAFSYVVIDYGIKLVFADFLEDLIAKLDRRMMSRRPTRG